MNEPLLALAAALGTRSADLITTRLSEAGTAGLSDEVGELLLMALFVTGFPAGLEAARLWRTMRPSRPAGEGRHGPDGAEAARRGREVGRAVYGDQFEPLMEGLEALHPDLPALVVDVGYGRMMGRPGLPLATRELCMVAMLVPWRAETQLYSHMRGALLVGASREAVQEAVEAGCRAAEATGAAPAVARAARDAWARVKRRGETRG